MNGRWWWIVVAGVLAYSNSFTGPFFFDDSHGITENQSIRQMNTALTPPPASGMAGRPLVNLTFALNYAADGYNVRGYHAVNLAIHLLAGLVLFGIVRRTPGGEALALPVALLWVLHPLATEGVTYISQRTESLMGLFLLLTLYCAIRGWNVLAVLACGLGMACKEVMVVAPLIVVVYDHVFGKRRPGLYAGLAATWLMLPLLVGSVALRAKMGEGLDYFTPWTYAKTQGSVILHYLRLAVVPYPLVVDYDDWPRVASLWPGALVAGLVAWAAWGAWKKQWWGFLGLWFFLILGPTSSFLPMATEVAAERRMYLPLMAVVVAVVMVLRNKAVMLAMGCGVLTFLRNADYRTEESIWRSVVEHRPNNARALVNLGAAVKPVEAIGLYERAVKIEPANAEAHYNLGMALLRLARLADAVPHFQVAADLRPTSSRAQFQLGVVLAQQGQWEQAEEAIRRALVIEPGNKRATDLLTRIQEHR